MPASDKSILYDLVMPCLILSKYNIKSSTEKFLKTFRHPSNRQIYARNIRPLSVFTAKFDIKWILFWYVCMVASKGIYSYNYMADRSP